MKKLTMMRFEELVWFEDGGGDACDGVRVEHTEDFAITVNGKSYKSDNGSCVIPANAFSTDGSMVLVRFAGDILCVAEPIKRAGSAVYPSGVINKKAISDLVRRVSVAEEYCGKLQESYNKLKQDEVTDNLLDIL